MSSRRGSRQSRAFANFAGPSNAGERERVVSRYVEIILNGAPGVVCQLADHTQGTKETIEVTVVPRRRPGKLIVRLEEDESCEDSLASPKVVVTTTRSDSRQEGPRHRHHQSRGRNDENVAPGNNQNDDDDDEGDDEDTESLRVNTGRNRTPATAERKTGARKPSYTEEQNAPSKYTSSFAGPSHPAHDRVYQADHLAPPPPGSAATGHGSTAFRRLSSPFDFARRLSEKAPWKSSSRAANPQPVDREKTRDTGNNQHRESYRDSYHRHSNGKRKGDHDQHHRSTRARSSANPSPTAESFGTTSTPGSYLDDFEHRCHSCGKPRCDYIQNERPVREGEKVKPSLCSSCQSKLGSSRHKILGPDGKDLSQKYWCDTCGFLRSTRYHIANGFLYDNDPRRPKEDNMCSWCIRAEKRRDEEEQERERQLEDIQAKLTKKNTKLNETIGQPAPPPASTPTSYRSSSYGSYLAPPPAPRQRYRRPQPDDEMDIDDSDNAYNAHAKGINTTSTTRVNSFTNASIRTHRGPTNLAPTPPPISPEAPIALPQRVGTPRPTPQTQVEDAPASPSQEGTDDNGGGFINNPSAFWAKVGDDPMLRACFEQDPREAAARRARLAGDYRGPSVTEYDDTSSIAQGMAGLEFTGPRIVELASDEEE